MSREEVRRNTPTVGIEERGNRRWLEEKSEERKKLVAWVAHHNTGVTGGFVNSEFPLIPGDVAVASKSGRAIVEQHPSILRWKFSSRSCGEPFAGE